MNQRAHKPMVARHLVLYDGDCALCNKSVRFILRHDRTNMFQFASLQGQFASGILKGRQFSTSESETVIIVANVSSNRPVYLQRSDAALFICGQLGWPWKMIRVVNVVPRGLRDWMYGVVAKNRLRMFGRPKSCPVIPPADLWKFPNS